MKPTLRLLRLKNDWPLKYVAEQVGVDANTISRYERGLVMPASQTAERYAKILGITQRKLNELLSEAQEQTREEATRAGVESRGVAK